MNDLYDREKKSLKKVKSFVAKKIGGNETRQVTPVCHLWQQYCHSEQVGSGQQGSEDASNTATILNHVRDVTHFANFTFCAKNLNDK